MILNPESPNEEDLDDQKFLEIFQEATDLYGLLHADNPTGGKAAVTVAEAAPSVNPEPAAV